MPVLDLRRRADQPRTGLRLGDSPLFALPERNGASVLTTVSGPTCMAFDRLARLPLPENLAIGDLVVWTHAGAYHLPWETRFSRGLSRVIWYEANGSLQLVREEESFDDWWGQWR